MKHKAIHFYVQCKDGIKEPEIVCHSTDDETGEMYHKFLDRSKANKLMADEMKVNPTLKYRVVKLTENFETEDWK